MANYLAIPTDARSLNNIEPLLYSFSVFYILEDFSRDFFPIHSMRDFI